MVARGQEAIDTNAMRGTCRQRAFQFYTCHFSGRAGCAGKWLPLHRNKTIYTFRFILNYSEQQESSVRLMLTFSVICHSNEHMHGITSFAHFLSCCDKNYQQLESDPQDLSGSEEGILYLGTKSQAAFSTKTNIFY